MSGPLRLAIAAMVATIAASMSLSAVFASSGWIFPVVGAIVLVSGSCALIRWSPLPSFLEPFTAALAVLLWVSWLYARPESRFGVIPTGAAFSRLRVLAQTGGTDIHKLPPPVPTHPGLVLITVLAVAAVALIVDLMTVTLRRSALAGLPLLAVFTVCAATSRHGVNVFAFAAAAVGYLVLLFADSRERVSRWGSAMGASNARPAPTRSAENELPSAPASLGRRVGAAAIGISVVIPLAIPGMHAGFRGHGGGGRSGNGNNSVTTIDPIVSVDHELASSLDAPVLSYQTTAQAPGYLRMTSLDNFSSDSFTASSLNAPISARVTNGLGVIAPSSQRFTTTMSVAKDIAFRWLPMPTTATAVSVPGDWRYDPNTSTTFSASDTTEGLHYSVVSSPDLPTPAQLAHASSTIVGGPAADLAHPNIDAQVRTLTGQITAGANSKYDAALDIQRYLTSSRFSYKINPPVPPGNEDGLAYFLLQSRAGFCQQYSTAMAVMARLVGIPSRVAVGFTAGTRQPNGTWLVTTHDAHAWPELYFPNFGWLAFEPTPRGDGQAVTPSYARALPNQHGGSQSGSTSQSDGPDPIHKPGVTGGSHGKGGSTKGSGAKGAAGASTGSFGNSLWLPGLALIAVLLLIPAGTRQVTRRRRLLLLHGGHIPPSVAWAELRDSAIDAGAPWADGASPRQVATALFRWLGSSSDVSEPLARLTHAEEVDRYAAHPDVAPASLPADLRALLGALRRRRDRRQSVRAVLLPPSTMGRINARLSSK